MPRKKLAKSAFEAIAREKGRSVETVILTELMSDAHCQGACQDWADIKTVLENAICLLVPSIGADKTFELLKEVIYLYDTEVITIKRSIPKLKRLALFLSQIEASMYETREFREWFVKNELEGNVGVDRSVMRGLVLRRIATRDALNVTGRFFRADLLRADHYTQRRAEATRIRMLGLQPAILGARL